MNKHDELSGNCTRQNASITDTDREHRLEVALKRIIALTPAAANAFNALDLHLTVKTIALDALSTQCRPAHHDRRMEQFSLTESVARAMDPAIWADDVPIPTNLDIATLQFRRQISTRRAEAALAAIASMGMIISPEADV